MSMIPKNGRPSRIQIVRMLKGLTLPSSRSKTFRKLAADALRAGRKAPPGGEREAHFSVAASYKSLAHDDEWMCGERQRSQEQPRCSSRRRLSSSAALGHRPARSIGAAIDTYDRLPPVSSRLWGDFAHVAEFLGPF
jgi:hypothetical protein